MKEKVAGSSHRDRWRRIFSVLPDLLRWLVVLAPIVGCALLVRRFWLNQMFLDDWMLAGDLLAFRQGTLSWHDLFAVQMEHRLAFPRALALALGVLCHGDVRAQNALTVVLLAGVWAVGVRWWLRRSPRLPVSAAWLPLTLTGMVVFSPVQVQTLLWAVCFGTVLPIFLLALCLEVAQTASRGWLRFVVCAACAVLGTLSFAPGLLIWVLAVPVFLWTGPARSARQRWIFVGAWAGVCALTMVLYFHDFKNAVPPAYAYGRGAEDAMGHDVKAFLQIPGADVRFVLVFLGSLLSRGLPADEEAVALGIGVCLLAVYAGLVAFAWWRRRDDGMRNRLLPWLALGAYSPATAVLVAMGRVWTGVPTALHVRYYVHQTPLVIGVIAALWIVLNEGKANSGERFGGLRRLAGVAAGGLAVLLLVGWLFGAQMMEQWNAARLRDRAAQKFVNVFPPNPHISRVAGNFAFLEKIVRGLSQSGDLGDAPLPDRLLSRFKRGPKALAPENGQFEALTKLPDGSWVADGFAVLPGHRRPADAILLAYRARGGEPWIIFGLTQALGPPLFLSRSITKDLHHIIPRGNPWPDKIMGDWQYPLAIAEEPPASARITAWALDARRMEIRQVPRKHGTLDSDERGLSIEELSRWPQ